MTLTNYQTTPPTDSYEYNATKRQIVFHNALRYYTDVLFCAGRGAGKTTAGAQQAKIESLFYQPGETGLVIEPTYNMIFDVALPELSKAIPKYFIERKIEGARPTLWLTNGSKIALRSADNPDGLRGGNIAWLWLDEPRNIKTREAFDIASAQLRKQRRVWLTTTPAGIFHWLYDLFVVNPIPNSKVVYATSYDNPHNSESFARNLEQQYTGVFKDQEIGAKWVSFEGLVYDNFSIADSGNVSISAEYNPDLPIIAGIDDGYVHPRVILLGQPTADNHLNIFAEYVTKNELPETSIRSALKDYPSPSGAYIDSTAVDIKIILTQMGIFTVSATHKVADGIKFVRRLLCDGNGVRLLKIHPRCKHLIKCLQTYRYDERLKGLGNGELTPLKEDDDPADALRYMCRYFVHRLSV